MNTTIDLRTCKKGDILISKHGKTFIYEAPSTPPCYYDHIIIDPEFPEGRCSRTHDGHTFRHSRMPDDHDIVEIRHLTDSEHH